MEEKDLDDFEGGELQLKRLNREEAARCLEQARRKELWNLRATGVYEAQKYSLGEGVKIAIINSGADVEHPEIRDRFGEVKGINYVLSERDEKGQMTKKSIRDLTDENGHGTCIASIVAGKGIGIAPEATLYVLKIADKNGDIKGPREIRDAIERCLTLDVDIINLSLGIEEYDGGLMGACQKAYNENIILVAAAGNKSSGAFFPASYDGVISVATIGPDNKRDKFSCIWPTNDIAAPGVGILGACNLTQTQNYETSYAIARGTSMATAHVTGILALALSHLRSMGKSTNPKQLEALMKETASIPQIDEEEIKDLLRTLGFNLIKDIGTEEFVMYMYGSGMVRADGLVANL